MFGARIKIMWEEQLVDPLIHYIKAKEYSFTLLAKICQIDYFNNTYNKC